MGTTIDSLQVMSWVATALVAVGSGACVGWACELDGVVRVTVGPRGLQRAIALRESSLFAAVEPAVRWWAARIAVLPLGSIRAALSHVMQRAGSHKGLSPDELLALGALVAVGTTAVGFGMGLVLDAPLRGCVVGGGFGPTVLALSLHARRQQRAVEVDRGLPVVIDLISMCVGAGLDFPGAVRLVVDAGSARSDVLNDELRMVLRELELGRTRAHALSAFAERLPTRSVSEFVSSVVQAEGKGTPLSEVLRIQATVLRGRRSVLAEEAAARAGVLMMFPLLLLLACVMLIAMGGMMIRGTDNGL